MTGRDATEERQMILLAAAEVSAAQQRDACIVLAGKALDACGGDQDAARDMLRVPLEAIGAIGYETAVPMTEWGAPRQAPKKRQRGGERHG